MATQFAWGSRDSLPLIETVGGVGGNDFARLSVVFMDEDGTERGGGGPSLGTVDQGAGGGDPWLVTVESDHAEDAPHVTGAAGSFMLAVRNDGAGTSFTDTDGDYSPIAVTSRGEVFVTGTVGVAGTVAVTQSTSPWVVSGTVAVSALPAIPAGTNNIGDVDVLTVPADPFGLNADAASATGSISAKLRFLASSLLVDNAGFTDGTSLLMPAGFIFDAVAGTALTENDIAAARIDAKRAQVQVIEDGTTRGRFLTVLVGGAALVDGNIVDNAGFTDGTTRVFPSGFIFDETAGTALTENDVGAARMDSKRAVVTVLEDATTRGRRQTVSAAGAALVDIGAALPAGTNNIGDVDVLSVVPGVGATNLGKAEDAAHASGDTGVAVWGVRSSSGADFTFSDTNGDYTPFAVNPQGRLWVQLFNNVTVSEILSDVETRYIEGPDAAPDAFGLAAIGARRNDDGATAFASTDGDMAYVACDDRGRLITSNTPPGTYTTDDFTASPTTAAAHDITHKPAGLFSLQVTGVGGSPTAWDVRLQISLDGTSFTQVLQHVSGTQILGQVINLGLTTIAAPCRFFRIFLSNSTPLNLNGATALRVHILAVPA